MLGCLCRDKMFRKHGHWCLWAIAVAGKGASVTCTVVHTGNRWGKRGRKSILGQPIVADEHGMPGKTGGNLRCQWQIWQIANAWLEGDGRIGLRLRIPPADANARAFAAIVVCEGIRLRQLQFTTFEQRVQSVVGLVFRAALRGILALDGERVEVFI